MYELLVLSLLMRFPLHAYMIAKIANDTIGPWEKISRGTLSTLLKKLDKAGFITDADQSKVPFPSERPSRVYEITQSGRERFAQLMMDTTSNLGNYQRIFEIKSIHLEFMTKEEQIYLVSHYIDYCQKAIHHLQAQIQEFEDNPDAISHFSDTPFYSTVNDLIMVRQKQWRTELEWAQQLREGIMSQIRKEYD